MIRKKLLSGEVLLGFYLPFPSAELAEFMGLLGFDYVLIDAEHFTYGIETVQRISRAAEFSGMGALVRVPSLDPSLILGYLETGISGIVAPHLTSEADARRLVRAVKYPPLGLRGAGSTTRAAKYGLTQASADYFSEANQRMVVFGMVEDEEGITNLKEILAVEGIDGMAVGSGDLAMAMGYPGKPSHPNVKLAINPAKQMIKSSDKALGVMATSIESAQKAVAEGAGYVTLSLGSILSQVGKEYLSQIREPISK